MSILKDIFTKLVLFWGNDEATAAYYWQNVEKAYSTKGRHYHTLKHINDMYAKLKENRSCIIDFDAVVFALIWHDIIYNPLKKDNEEKSAEHARKCLKELNVPDFKAEKCIKHILASKNHKYSHDNDTNFFTDADLNILGSPPEIYREYTEQIRKEYHMIPNAIYKNGRKKVLTRFLSKKKIFKTEYTYFKKERQARENLETELKNL